jgi:hypothetical protein
MSPRASLAALCFLAGACAPALAHAADWELLAYRLPDNGHPCMNDPYHEAGYVWIRKDADSALHKTQLREQVKAANAHPDFLGAHRVGGKEGAFLVTKRLRCRNYDGKSFEANDHEFLFMADEASVRSYMDDRRKKNPDVLDYTVEAISRPTQELDASGTATVVGRVR